MTAQDLKNSILQLAVQGKLVPQDPSDEPASELLKRIRAEKAKLIAEGKIKKEKALPAITDEEKPFDIPDSWKWGRLGDYCLDAFSGKSPVYSKTPTQYFVVGQAANQQSGLDYSQLKYTTSDFWKSMEEKYFLLEGDVLLNTLGNGTLGRAGIIDKLDKQLLTDGHLFVFRHISGISAKYFYYFLQYKRPEIEKAANGSTNQTFLPILDRRMQEIAEDITLDKNSNQLSGLSNQIRDCYIVLSDYLMNKVRSQNPNFKNDNFKDNLEEFLKVILPGAPSETRRNVINTIAQKGWKMTAEMVHKDSVTVFDILISFNILQLIVSTISNIVVGNNMPFNKVKCPLCMGEKHTMQQNKDKERYQYICSSCGHAFEVSMDDIIKKL